jgi:site-specific recombinase XerD
MPQPYVRLDSIADLAAGPFRDHVAGFDEVLRSQGYSSVSRRLKRLILAELSRWLRRHRVDLGAFDEECILGFLRERRRRYRTCSGVSRTCRQFLDHLRSQGAVPPAPPPPAQSPLDALADEYASYLRSERGLAEATIAFYIPLVRRLLAQAGVDMRGWLQTLEPAAIPRFVLGLTRIWGVHTVKGCVTALRSFLRFLYVRGLIPRDLATAVPAVPRWKGTTVPKFISVEDVHRIVQTCDRRVPTGRRDYAILLLLARLGLRAAEVRYLTLDDIDWDAAELHVRGKGGRHDRVPLPSDVGKALAVYLRHDRSRCTSRRVFIGARAPLRGLGVGAVAAVVRRAIKRSGLPTPTMGPHLLRHSLATGILRRGGSLAEISELLRHGHPQTTTLYAKVDFSALREVSPPWPEGEP